MTTFATLGPAGTNHELVTARYIAFHRIAGARIVLVDRFEEAVALVLSRRADFVVQCAAHPDFAGTIGGNRKRLYAIDSFIAPSRALGIVARTDVDRPRSLGYQPATLAYVDAARWTTLVAEPSIVAVADGLLAGRYDAGITAIDFADAHPDAFRIVDRIGTVDDVWVVYGTERMCDGDILAWPDCPAGALLRTAPAHAMEDR